MSDSGTIKILETYANTHAHSFTPTKTHAHISILIVWPGTFQYQGSYFTAFYLIARLLILNNLMILLILDKLEIFSPFL